MKLNKFSWDSKLKEFFWDSKHSKIFWDQNNFLEPYAVNVVKNFIAGVGYFAKKTKEIEQDARKKFCDYPSA